MRVRERENKAEQENRRDSSNIGKIAMKKKGRDLFDFELEPPELTTSPWVPVVLARCNFSCFDAAAIIPAIFTPMSLLILDFFILRCPASIPSSSRTYASTTMLSSGRTDQTLQLTNPSLQRFILSHSRFQFRPMQSRLFMAGRHHRGHGRREVRVGRRRRDSRCGVRMMSGMVRRERWPMLIILRKGFYVLSRGGCS